MSPEEGDVGTGNSTTAGEPASEPVDGGDRQVSFDYYNVLVYHNETREFIQVIVNVPLDDGAAAEAKVTLGAPFRFVKEGKPEYRMNFNTSLSVVQSEKKPTGRVEVQSRDGLSWEIPAGYPGAWTSLLEHEPRVREFLIAHFRPGHVFVDVGANVGAYSLRAASTGMKVIAFEPNQENVEVLKRNAEINHLSVDLQEYALGSTEGRANITPNGATTRISADGSVDVPLRTLDSFDLARVDLLKVDVEGYELEVLRGARETLARCRPTMMIEMHDWLGAEDEAALFDILLGTGYRFLYLDKYAHGRHLIAARDPDNLIVPSNRAGMLGAGGSEGSQA